MIGRLTMAVAAAALVPSLAVAAVRTVEVVKSAEARVAGRTLTLEATVQLPNGCWSNPRFARPSRDAAPDADGVVPVKVVADSSEGPGLACPMIVRPPVAVPALKWRGFPGGLKAVKVEGWRVSALARVNPRGTNSPSSRIN
jgi:hypothetical protein